MGNFCWLSSVHPTSSVVLKDYEVLLQSSPQNRCWTWVDEIFEPFERMKISLKKNYSASTTSGATQTTWTRIRSTAIDDREALIWKHAARVDYRSCISVRLLQFTIIVNPSTFAYYWYAYCECDMSSKQTKMWGIIFFNCFK